MTKSRPPWLYQSHEGKPDRYNGKATAGPLSAETPAKRLPENEIGATNMQNDFFDALFHGGLFGLYVPWAATELPEGKSRIYHTEDRDGDLVSVLIEHKRSGWTARRLPFRQEVSHV